MNKWKVQQNERGDGEDLIEYSDKFNILQPQTWIIVKEKYTSLERIGYVVKFLDEVVENEQFELLQQLSITYHV